MIAAVLFVCLFFYILIHWSPCLSLSSPPPRHHHLFQCSNLRRTGVACPIYLWMTFYPNVFFGGNISWSFYDRWESLNVWVSVLGTVTHTLCHNLVFWQLSFHNRCEQVYLAPRHIPFAINLVILWWVWMCGWVCLAPWHIACAIILSLVICHFMMGVSECAWHCDILLVP